jgi:hypothetical protein
MKKYIVTLTREERDELFTITSKGKHSSQKPTFRGKISARTISSPSTPNPMFVSGLVPGHPTGVLLPTIARAPAGGTGLSL